MASFTCLREEIILYYINNHKNVSSLEFFLREKQVSEDHINFIIEDFQRILLHQFNKRWAEKSRSKELFLKYNSTWLKQNYTVMLPASVDEVPPLMPSTSTGNRGRPSVAYEIASISTKKRKNTTLIKEYGIEHIQDAYIQALRSTGKGVEANLIEAIKSADNTTMESLFKFLVDRTPTARTLSDEEALSVFVDLDLTKAQYLYLRNLGNENNCFFFPPYSHLQKCKRTCYPPSSSMEITNVSAKVLSLQDLLDHTTARILKIDSVYKAGLRRLILYSKWGCDGSSGQSEYKQKLPEESELISDSNLFITSLVPIKLINSETSEIVWQNPVPSSVRFCRPISIEFSKETPQKTREVVDKIKLQINSISPTLINKEGEGLVIKHQLFLTMIDGKVAQVLTETPSSSTCTICRATPRQMNDLDKVSARPEDTSSYQYGLSTLHAWIRCMEMFLHISYNLSFMKWSATNENNKRLKQEKKTYVQRRFREELGLIIDKPRQVSGNSNDGNTARRFFYNADCSAEITGIDETLIRRFYIILQALSSGIMIDAKKFGEYALQTARLYVSKYNWFYMPSSVHKILIHGESIINHFSVLPIGQLSEDAQESRNKDYKKFRLHHARKCSRSATNEDVFHTLLYTSDPYISSIRKQYLKNIKELDEDTLVLLKVHKLIVDPAE